MPKAALDLTGAWQFKQYPLSARRMRDLDPADWQQTNVPCSIFTSLIETGQIESSQIKANPENFAWVSERPWIYRKIFDAPVELLNCSRVELVFEGLDTIASIWLNDKLVAKTNNMFIPFRFDVTELLKPRNNTLLVKFTPPAKYAKKLMNRYTTFESLLGYPERVYIRKAQYQFGWDWCPGLPGCGIWRPVRLEGVEKAKLADLHIRTIDCNEEFADVRIAVELDALSEAKFDCRFDLSCGEQEISYELTFNPGEHSHSTVIHIKKPFLWWPLGYGEQSLYQLDVQLSSNGQIIDQRKKSFGIRTVKLNHSTKTGSEKFQFEINGQAVYAKGADWIPPWIFAGSVRSNDYQELLQAAAAANMNMLRIWGGGYYEADEFYELCDELGIMVWQDFMFACAYYPDRKWFAEEVKAEATAIIQRLRNHPCLVLWCGNNEIDWLHSIGMLGKSKKFYGKAIYHQLLPQLVAELDPDKDYIPTTPLGTKETFKTGRTLTKHQWEIWSGHQPIRKYLCRREDVPPFVTEFGLQSLPSIETIKSFCPAEKLRIASYCLEKHNYQLDGNSRIYRYIGDLFGPAKNVEQLVYLSQVMQARGVKTYVEHLRAHKSRNSGVLFWQFNDCCPAISWSAIDNTREPKAVYYYARRFFSDLLITVVSAEVKAQNNLQPKPEPFNVVAINDSPHPVTATLNCRLIDLFGNVLDRVSFPIAIAPLSTSTASKLPRGLISPNNPENSVLHISLDKEGAKIAQNSFFYLPDKYINWPKPQITKSLRQVTDRQWKLKLKSDVIAKDVQINLAAKAQFSDNFIDLMPQDEFEITINCEREASSVEPELQLRHLQSMTLDKP